MSTKKLTQKERAARARAKKALQAEGIIPPNKPRLNRKAFAREVLEALDLIDACEIHLYIYLHMAVASTISADAGPITQEQVGALKLLKTIIETKKYIEESGRPFNTEEYFERVVRPIGKL